MPLNFDGASALRLASTSVNFGGPFTFAAVARRTDESRFCDVVVTHNSGGTFSGWDCGARSAPGKEMYVYTALGTGDVAGPTWNTADNWCLLVWKKATGTQIPVYHKYVYDTQTWTHQTGSTAIANGTGFGVSGSVRLGRFESDTTGALIGDIAMAGAWASVLTQDQVMALPFSLAAWYQNSPRGLWVLDPAASGQNIRDMTGQSAGETARDAGATVTSDSVPNFNRGHSPIYATTSVAPGGSSDSDSGGFGRLLSVFRRRRR